jgi:hypothetical protein
MNIRFLPRAFTGVKADTRVIKFGSTLRGPRLPPQQAKYGLAGAPGASARFSVAS